MDEVKRFYDDVSRNIDQMSLLTEMDKAELVAYANKKGYQFTQADMDEFGNSLPRPAQLTEGALDANGACGCALVGVGAGGIECGCFWAGDGANSRGNHCVCYLGGVGVD